MLFFIATIFPFTGTSSIELLRYAYWDMRYDWNSVLMERDSGKNRDHFFLYEMTMATLVYIIDL